MSDIVLNENRLSLLNKLENEIKGSIKTLKDHEYIIVKSLYYIKKDNLYKDAGFSWFKDYLIHRGFLEVFGLKFYTIQDKLYAYQYCIDNDMEKEYKKASYGKLVFLKEKNIKGKDIIKNALSLPLQKLKRDLNIKNETEKTDKIECFKFRIPVEYSDDFLDKLDDLCEEYAVDKL